MAWRLRMPSHFLHQQSEMRRTWALRVIALLSVTVLHPLAAQSRDSAQRGVRSLPASVGDALSDTLPAVRLSGGCQVSRTVLAAGAGYLGYLIGSLAQLPLTLADGPTQLTVGFQVAGVISAVVLFADEPLSRPIPFCPKSMRTLSNGKANGPAACRASRMLNGILGAAGGAVAATAVALPFVLAKRNNGTVASIFIALPAAGAVVGAIRAGRSPPCA